MASSAKVAIITGANQGIGYGIAHRLARLYPTSYYAKTSSSTGSSADQLVVYFTARNVERGNESLKKLTDELKGSKVLAQDGGLTTFKFHQLDITDPNSRSALRQTIADNHGTEGIDLLINNAGIALDGFDAEVVKKTLATNYYATRDMITEFAPAMRKNGRIVTLASMSGHLKGYSDSLVSAFHGADTQVAVDNLMSSFQSAVSAGTNDKDGWKQSAYCVSKAGVIALHRALAKQYSAENAHFLLNACCPGYVDTSMTKHKGHLTLDEGAATPVTLALDDIGGKNGTFWERQKESQW